MLSALLQEQGELHAVGHLHIRAVGSSAQLACFLDRTLGLKKPAGKEHAGGAKDSGTPKIEGLASRLSQRPELFDVRLCTGNVPTLQSVGQAPEEGAEYNVGVSGVPPQFGGAACDLAAIHRFIRAPDCEVSTDLGRRHEELVSRSPCDLDGLGRKFFSELLVGAVVLGFCQATKQFDSEFWLIVT